MGIPWRDVATAVIIVAFTIIVGWVLKAVGQWLKRALLNSFAGVVVDCMAPEMAHQTTKVTKAIDEMQARNTAEHAATSERLGSVEGRLTSVEEQLAELRHIVVRPSTSRTRATDHADTHEGNPAVHQA